MEDMEKMHQERIGKPWAMVFYHTSYEGMNSVYLLKGVLYDFLALLLATIALYSARKSLNSFGKRFAFTMLFPLFAACNILLPQSNWWAFHFDFIRATLLNLGIGFSLVALWLAWYIGKGKKYGY
jgi:hypothetical protein